ncbi:SsgA family sporulation/cell division regulator [Kitasatospora aureofaciens]|uniref:SsgA family sporulation/cell division regulator n=1 Tax=Kitasatospora aureofaciens TaxID=1894 RepID=UPI001C46ACBA|nr:SsgA family sporulation/cell division regulator [Kitasatospora aureofaciens]MBV6702733.1 SsgA family sporulation/cell division regulator [Kitasatospora aureofaciens]
MNEPHEMPGAPQEDACADEELVLYIDLEAVACPGLLVSVPARLRYRPEDPYAICLDTHVDLDEPITWIFARELLATGLTGWSGLGDVTVHRGTGPGSHTLFIALSADDTTAVLRAPASLVAAFLTATEHLVPYGSETLHVDVDDLILRLMEADGPPLV